MDRNRQPAVRLAICISCGILAAYYSPFAVQITAGALAVCAVICRLVPLLAPDYRGAGRTLFFILLTVLLGTAKFGLDSAVFDSADISYRCASPVSGILSGRITEEPRMRPGRLTFILRTSGTNINGSHAEASGDVLVTVFLPYDTSSQIPDVRYGNDIALRGIIEDPTGPRNPGEFNYRNYLLLNGVRAVMTVHGSENVMIESRNEGSFLVSSILLPIRVYVRNAIDGYVGGTEGAFLKGLVIGERDDIPAEVQASFIDAGVVHVLAVSGLNVAFVALILVALTSFLPVHRVLKTAVTIALLILYMFVTGATPSIVRATLMVVVVLAGKLLQRRVDVLNAVAVSALVIYAFDTRQFFDVGFQLSYAAVVSLVLLYPAISGLYTPALQRSRRRRVFLPVANLMTASFAAQAGTVPLLVQYFGRLSLVSFAANIVVVPAANLGLALGFVLVFVSLVSSWLAGLYAAVVQLLLSLTLRFISIAAHFRWSVVEIRMLLPWHTAAYYISAGLLWYLWKGSGIRKMFVAALVAINFIVFVYATTPVPPADMKITFLDVGQGDAALVEFPGRAAALIDCGGLLSASDAGTKHILPYLRRSGIERLDAIIITHMHADHMGGAESIVESMPVGTIYANTPSVESELFTRLLQAAGERNVPVCRLEEGMEIGFGETARFFVMHPPPDSAKSVTGSDATAVNNSSIVLRICYGRSSALFTGDAGEAVENRLCISYGSFLHSTVMKVAHHGSMQASSGRFVSLVDPAYAVVSVGKNNRFGHPSAEILERYAFDSVRVRRTDENGAVVFWLTPDSVREERWR